MRENHRAILRAEIWSLTIGRGWVVHIPKCIEQTVVRNLCRIEGDLHDFCMPSPVRADVLVAWIDQGATFVADRGIRDARNLTKSRFNAPEAAGAKRCEFHVNCLPD